MRWTAGVSLYAHLMCVRVIQNVWRSETKLLKKLSRSATLFIHDCQLAIITKKFTYDAFIRFRWINLDTMQKHNLVNFL